MFDLEIFELRPDNFELVKELHIKHNYDRYDDAIQDGIELSVKFSNENPNTPINFCVWDCDACEWKEEFYFMNGEQINPD